MKIIKIATEITAEMVLDPNRPPEILAEVLRREKDDWVSIYAVQNPNCPPEALAEVLRRGKDNEVSRYAAENKNCPPEYNWFWKNKIERPTTWFLNYLDAPVEVENNPEIFKLVKQDLVKTLNELLIGKISLTDEEKNEMNKIVDYLSKSDFVVSLYKDKIT
jgi:hypothetical protein